MRILFLGLLLVSCLVSCHGWSACRQTIGLENRNPGNVSPIHLRYWPGAVGHDQYGHAIFDTDKHGLEALRRNLIAYWRIHHLNTVRKIVRRWTSKKDNQAERKDYMNGICWILGVGPDTPVDMENSDVLERLGKAISLEESACKDAYPDSMWDQIFNNPQHNP